MDEKCERHSKRTGDCWANYDGYGIFLCYVCPDCEDEKMSHFRSDINERYECDEPIEEDY